MKYSENINKYRNSIFLNRCGKAIAIKPGIGKKEHGSGYSAVYHANLCV